MSPAGSPLKIGVTGSRSGPTREQWATVTSVLADLTEDETVVGLYHGDCVGFDDRVHAWARMDTKQWVVTVCPGDDRSDLRAYCDGDVNLPPATNRTRNALIAEVCDVLVAAPNGLEAERRYSGTWATVRLARKANKPIVVVLPDGRVIREPRS